MGQTPSSRKPQTWFSKRAMAAIFDVSERYFDRAIRPLIPEKHVRREAGRLFFHPRGVIEAWADARAAKRKNGVAAELELDTMLTAAGL